MVATDISIFGIDFKEGKRQRVIHKKVWLGGTKEQVSAINKALEMQDQVFGIGRIWWKSER